MSFELIQSANILFHICRTTHLATLTRPWGYKYTPLRPLISVRRVNSLTHISIHSYTYIYIYSIYLSLTGERDRGREEKQKDEKRKRRGGEQKERKRPRRRGKREERRFYPRSSPEFSATERVPVSVLTHIILIYVACCRH